MEKNAKTVQAAIHAKDEDVSKFGQIISECKRLMTELQFTISHVNRTANEAANTIADGAWSRPISRPRRDRKPNFNYNFYYN